MAVVLLDVLVHVVGHGAMPRIQHVFERVEGALLAFDVIDGVFRSLIREKGPWKR